MIDTVVEQAFRPAAEAVASGRIPGAALGLVTASGERAVRLTGAAQKVLDAKNGARVEAARVCIHLDDLFSTHSRARPPLSSW